MSLGQRVTTDLSLDEIHADAHWLVGWFLQGCSREELLRLRGTCQDCDRRAALAQVEEQLRRAEARDA